MRLRNILGLALAAVGLSLVAVTPASAYYHFIQYLYVNGAGNASSIPEKFDLAALPNQTVTFYITENDPTTYLPNDSFNSVLAQIRQAIGVWNGVSSSSLRVAYGGMENSATTQNAPGADVIFEDLPPGIYGYGGPTTMVAARTDPNGNAFVPVTRSTVHLNVNLTAIPGPSYSELFFRTLVHEIGHALGLQHPFTSSAMSQATTSSTSWAHPLTADDVAGLSVLYPNAKFARYGTITGQITVGGQPVHLASVVAIRQGADAVSGVTNPDGTYRIDGLAPGDYFVYVHTMPPDADIYGPWNSDGSVAVPSGPVNTLFYTPNGGMTGYQQATLIAVQAGQTTANINIATTALPSVPVYDGGVYAYLNNNTAGPIKPAPVNRNSAVATTVASVTGIGSNGRAPDLNVQVMGNSAIVEQNGIVPYAANGSTYVALYLVFNLFGSSGLQHMVFTSQGYTYVLPAAINLVQNPPPTITSALSNSDGTVTITGTTWASDTAFYFDSMPATVVSIDSVNGNAIVTPPPGASGQTATLTAYNTDGQNSQYVQCASNALANCPFAPVTYTYPSLTAPQISTISPSSLPAGAEALVDITGTGFNFTQGLTSVGFGTSDIYVRRVFVLSPNHLVADVAVAAGAAMSTSDVSVLAGFELAVSSNAFQITPAQSGLPVAVPVLPNGVSGLNGSYAGAIVSLYGANMQVGSATPVVAIGGQTATLLYVSPGQINLVIPANLPPGPALLTLYNGAAASWPVMVNIDSPPAGIAAIQSATGAYITNSAPAVQGQFLIVSLSGVAPSGSTVDPSRVTISVNGVSHTAVAVNAAGSVYQVTFQLNADETVGPSQQLVVYVDGHSSLPASMPVALAGGLSAQLH